VAENGHTCSAIHDTHVTKTITNQNIYLINTNAQSTEEICTQQITHNPLNPKQDTNQQDVRQHMKNERQKYAQK
jgi:hypothetical protein